VCGHGYDAEDGDEDGSTRDEEGTNDHEMRKRITEDDPREYRVPEEGDGAEGSKNDDRQGRYLEDGTEHVGGDEDGEPKEP